MSVNSMIKCIVLRTRLRAQSPKNVNGGWAAVKKVKKTWQILNESNWLMAFWSRQQYKQESSLTLSGNINSLGNCGVQKPIRSCCIGMGAAAGLWKPWLKEQWCAKAYSNLLLSYETPLRAYKNHGLEHSELNNDFFCFLMRPRSRLIKTMV